MKSQEMSGSRAPGVSNYREDRGMRAGKYSWVWEAAQDVSVSAGEWEAGQLGRLHDRLPQPCSPYLGFFFYDLCFSSSQIFVHLPTLAPDGL